MSLEILDLGCMYAGETLNAAVSFVNKLTGADVLTGTPTVTETRTSDLTLTNKSLNSAALVVNDISVVANKAVLWTITGGTAGRQYYGRISVADNGSNAQTHVVGWTVQVIANP